MFVIARQLRYKNCWWLLRSCACVRVTCTDAAARAHRRAGVTAGRRPGDPNKVDFGEMLLNSSFECGISERCYVAFPGRKNLATPFEIWTDCIRIFLHLNFKILCNNHKGFILYVGCYRCPKWHLFFWHVKTYFLALTFWIIKYWMTVFPIELNKCVASCRVDVNRSVTPENCVVNRK